MSKKRTLQQLTIKDNFMFAAVMMDPENCKKVLECVIDRPVKKVQISTEKNIVYHPEYRGVRLDVFASDESGSHFNVEMQVVNKEILKRSRYYHSQMDMELLLAGTDYENLPDSYVIFICDFDPIGSGKYRYTKRQTFFEDDTYEYDDGLHTYLLSTKGRNEAEEPETLVKFMKYVGAGLEDSTKDFDDELVCQLQNSVAYVKSNREMESRYMLFEEMMQDEFRAGRAEGKTEGQTETLANCILEVLSAKGTVSEGLENRIHGISDLSQLTKMFSYAVSATSIADFEKESAQVN